jgi:hypothetical protein
MINIPSLLKFCKLSANITKINTIILKNNFSAPKNPIKTPKPTLNEYEAIKSR